MKTKKTKKKASKKTSTSRRKGLRLETVEINLGPEHRAYVEELADYACTDISMVCAVMMATGIFKAKRYDLPMYEENKALKAKLARCREIMEANDPGNARDIFGEPEPAPAPPAEPAAP